MAVTIKDISRHCGVSTATVSQVLNGVGRPGDETKKRILEAAHKFGYRPNYYAKAIRDGKFGAVSLLLSTHEGRSHLPPELLRGLINYFSEANIHLGIAKLPDSMLTDEQTMPMILRELMCDGFIVDFQTQIPDKMVTLLKTYHVPSVWVNVDKLDADSVYYNEYGAGLNATKHLVKLGHRHIAYIDAVSVWDSEDAHYSITARRRGYIDAMTKSGLSPRCIGKTTKTPRDERIMMCRDVLARDDAPTAFVAYTEPTALALQIAAASLGKRIPHDFSVIVFSGIDFLSNASNFFTVFTVPEYAAGKEAGEMLTQKIAMPEQLLPNRVLELEFHNGSSVLGISG